MKIFSSIAQQTDGVIIISSKVISSEWQQSVIDSGSSTFNKTWLYKLLNSIKVVFSYASYTTKGKYDTLFIDFSRLYETWNKSQLFFTKNGALFFSQI